MRYPVSNRAPDIVKSDTCLKATHEGNWKATALVQRKLAWNPQPCTVQCGIKFG